MEPPFHTPPPLVGLFVGGRSARMGFPKGLARFDGERVVDRVARHGAALGELVLVGVDPGYGLPHRRIDDAPDVEGPLAGLLALLAAAGGADVVALSCDLPFLDPATVAALAAPLRGISARLARRTPGAPLEPFVARYAGHLEPPLRAYAARSGRSIAQFVATVPHEIFVPPDTRSLDDWDDVDAVHRGGGALPSDTPCAIPRR